jgi:hypothetical protein
MHSSLLQLCWKNWLFFSIIVVVRLHELSWIKWIGHLKKEESQCCFAEKTYIVQNPVIEVQELSAPLIYSLEDGIMWIPSLL